MQANAQLQAGQVPMRTQPNMQEQANIHTKRDNCDHLLHVNTDPELEQFFLLRLSVTISVSIYSDMHVFVCPERVYLSSF